MKTSNKLLLGLIAFLGLCFFSFLIYAKSQMIDNSNTEWDNRNFQSSGQQRTYTYNNLDFKSLDLSGNHDYVLVQGPNQVTIKSDKNYQGLLKPMVEEDILTFIIQTDKDLGNYAGFNITISTPQLDEISINGNARLVTPSAFNAEDIRLIVNGPSQSDLEINANSIIINSNGNSQLNLQGTADKMKVDVSGPANIHAIKMKTREIALSASGASHTRVYATEKLDITAVGAAQILYEGNPKVNKNLHGVATVVQN